MRPIVINNRFRIDRRVGAGGFGLVYIGTDLHTHREVAIKLMPTTDEQNMLEHESRIYRELERGVGFPNHLWFGQQDAYRILVTELLGPSLEDLFTFCAWRFSLKTVLMIADQAIRRLEYMHNKGYIHCDVKPENFLLGTGKEGNVVYTIDFGLAKRIVTDHEEALPDQVFVGTADFASIRALERLEQSRRDDLEALGYVLIYFVRGMLPWGNLEFAEGDDVADTVLDAKVAMGMENLCAGLPAPFFKYMQYVRQLGFLQKPDYRKLRLWFSNYFHQRGFTNDNVFHWTHWRYRQLRGENFPVL